MHKFLARTYAILLLAHAAFLAGTGVHMLRHGGHGAPAGLPLLLLSAVSVALALFIWRGHLWAALAALLVSFVPGGMAGVVEPAHWGMEAARSSNNGDCGTPCIRAVVGDRFSPRPARLCRSHRHARFREPEQRAGSLTIERIAVPILTGGPWQMSLLCLCSS
jgi:hypothetical protein